MVAVKATLARTLQTTEYFTLAFGTMVGVGWLVLMDDWLTRGGPGGAMLGFLLGGIALIPVAFIYGKFVRQIPDAASEVAYATAVFPKSIGFFAGWLMTLAYLIVCPWEAVAVGRILSFLIPSLQTHEVYRVGSSPVYLPSLILGLFVTGAIVFLNFRGIRVSSRFQNLTTFGLLILFALFVLLGFTRIQPQNFQPFFSQSTPGSSWGGLISVILVLQIVPYFLTGFESVPKLAEEARSDFKPAGYVRAIFLGLAAGTLFYVLIIGVVSGLVPWKSLLSERFGTAIAFDKAFHSPVIVRLIFGAALLSLLKVFNANFLTASRLIFALGRRELIPSKFGEIHPDFHSPKNAVLFCGVITAIGTLLGSAILVPITEVGSMCSALGWTVTCIAYTRWQKTSGGSGNGAGIAILGALVAIVFLMLKILWFIPGSFGSGEYIALATWLLLGLALWNRKDAKV